MIIEDGCGQLVWQGGVTHDIAKDVADSFSIERQCSAARTTEIAWVPSSSANGEPSLQLLRLARVN